MKHKTIAGAVLAWAMLLAGCASLPVPGVSSLSACDLTDAAVCDWKDTAVAGVNRALDLADSRLCVDFDVQCPAPGGGLRSVPCDPYTCQTDAGVGDWQYTTVVVAP